MFVCNCFNSVEGKNIAVVQYTLDQSYLFSNGLCNMMIIVSNTNFHTLTEKDHLGEWIPEDCCL